MPHVLRTILLSGQLVIPSLLVIGNSWKAMRLMDWEIAIRSAWITLLKGNSVIPDLLSWDRLLNRDSLTYNRQSNLTPQRRNAIPLDETGHFFSSTTVVLCSCYRVPINWGIVGADIRMLRRQHPLVPNLWAICRQLHKTTVLLLTKSPASSAQSISMYSHGQKLCNFNWWFFCGAPWGRGESLEMVQCCQGSLYFVPNSILKERKSCFVPTIIH